ncbi:MAG: glycoside hydrolase family 3 C-terminal domain-containing protein [Alistipes sp.]|nr:glycoside hydrolase family 3 C-terminal domain-containing protein [Alistipes sp.]
MKLRTLLVATALFVAGCSTINKESENAIYLDENQPIDERVEDALRRMTLREKIRILHAQSKFSSAGVPRLGIPELQCTDGPHGVRAEFLWDEWEQAGWTSDSCTAFPALTCLAATWNPEMSAKYGKALGEEARYRDKDVLLGPGVNIYRTPLNGRNIEYMGEDPYLAAKLVVPYIQGVQANGVAACIKHFALNNQEHGRHHINAIVDDRALYEIYLPAFKAAVEEGGTWAIMPAYNKYNGQFCCHNERLLNTILKGEWGFDGAVISDWGGVHSTREAALNGLDMEFGTGTDGLSMGLKNNFDAYFLAVPYQRLIEKGELSTKELDDKVRRVLKLNFRTAMNTRKPFGALNSEEHKAIAREIGGEGIVLLKNENNVLPLCKEKLKRLLIVGENAIKMMTVGGGSASLKVQREYSPLEGIQQYVGDDVEVIYERGYVGDITGSYNGVKTGQDLRDERSPEQLIADAVKVAKSADAVIYFGGLNRKEGQDCEGVDRGHYHLPYDQNRVIEALAEANPNFVMINISGNAVEMPWVESVPAIIQAWFLGSEAGRAIAPVLFGEVNPSGHLPFTFHTRLQDYAAHSIGEYPGNGVDVRYNEGIFIGYRWADKQNIKTLFPFGHGLSYTTFEITEPQISKKSLKQGGEIKLKVEVRNTGERDGAEVVQLYISDKDSSLPRPVKELKGFKKLHLAAGESSMAEFTISEEELKFFDDKQHKWIAEKGEFTAHIATSAEEVLYSVDFTLK